VYCFEDFEEADRCAAKHKILGYRGRFMYCMRTCDSTEIERESMTYNQMGAGNLKTTRGSNILGYR